MLRHIVPISLLIRVQCSMKDLYKVVEGPSTRPIVLSMKCVRRSEMCDEAKLRVRNDIGYLYEMYSITSNLCTHL